MATPFVHLHVHTHYSMLDGACRIPDLVKRAKALGMPAVGITDHGCMHGVIEFYNECKKEGIKPLIGMEAYMAPGDRRERSTPSGSAGDAAFHLLLLAQDLEGYKNLIKLSSIAYREGFYYKPRVDKTILKELSKGLIATSACLGGEVCSAFMKRDGKRAREVAETYLEIFGPDRFFIEVQKQGVKEQDMVNPELVDLANKTGVGLIATNDVHFLNKDDYHAHDVLCCISMGRLVSDENRLKYPTELYLKSAEEMEAAGQQSGITQWQEAMSNTLRVAEMCKLELDFSKRYAPVYRVPGERIDQGCAFPSSPTPVAEMKDDERYLRQLCEEGLTWRYGTTEVSADVRERLEYELKVIIMKSFCSYFLIVWDFCNYARDNGIPVGARGSGVGTMVGYLLGLCNVDPLKYSLLFERFMDPSRNEMPDIDIDICQDGRQRVIEYVRNKYGHVAQIITFGTLAAKAACKDVGRVMGVPLAEIDKLTKLIPGTPGMTLKKAMAQTPDLADLYKNNSQIKQVIDTAQKLEGLCRNAGCHAAGVIIADTPLDGIVPLYKDSEDNILTQFEGPVAEKCGLLKMDFLGLRTLTIVERALDLERATREARGGRPKEGTVLDPKDRIDIEKVDITDQTVFKLFCRGETRGVFQFESGGMQDLLMKMQPDRLEDLIAANALYRPGPMELIPTYCGRKHGREKTPEIHPIMDGLLVETYGIMVYQEQVMQIFNQLGGIELSNAYKLIKAISKKTIDVIAKFQPAFLKGTMDKGVSKEKADEIFDHILKFGGYGFNKSHSTRYAFVAFQTGYMKTYHPLEYMAALLTFEMGSTDKVVEYIEECRRMTLLDGTKGIKVLPPDINISDVDFTPVYAPVTVKKGKKTETRVEGVIRFGLGAVKGVGTKAVEAIIAGRTDKGPFASLYDFCERVDLRAVNRATMEALIKCGAFDSLGARRAQLLAVLDRAIEMGQQVQADRRNGQMSMFGAPAAATPGAARPAEVLPDVKEFEPAELLKYEKDVLGFYITSHPLTEHQGNIERYSTCSTREAMSRNEGAEITIAGMIARVKNTVAKQGRSAGQKMAWVTLEDLEGQIEGVAFAETYAQICEKYPGIVAAEQIVLVKGKVDRRRETPSLVVNEIMPITEAVDKLTTAVVITLDRQRHGPDVLGHVRPVLNKYRGNVPVFAEVPVEGTGRVLIRLGSDCFVKPSKVLKEDLEQVLGSGCVDFKGAGSKRARQAQQQKMFAEEAEQAAPATGMDDAPMEAELAMSGAED